MAEGLSELQREYLLARRAYRQSAQALREGRQGLTAHKTAMRRFYSLAERLTGQERLSAREASGAQPWFEGDIFDELGPERDPIPSRRPAGSEAAHRHGATVRSGRRDAARDAARKRASIPSAFASESVSLGDLVFIHDQGAVIDQGVGSPSRTSPAGLEFGGRPPAVGRVVGFTHDVASDGLPSRSGPGVRVVSDAGREFVVPLHEDYPRQRHRGFEVVSPDQARKSGWKRPLPSNRFLRMADAIVEQGGFGGEEGFMRGVAPSARSTAARGLSTAMGVAASPIIDYALDPESRTPVQFARAQEEFITGLPGLVSPSELPPPAVLPPDRLKAVEATQGMAGVAPDTKSPNVTEQEVRAYISNKVAKGDKLPAWAQKITSMKNGRLSIKPVNPRTKARQEAAKSGAK